MNIGRNDPCPCGSGKKYKKCCINKANIAMPHQATAPKPAISKSEKYLTLINQASQLHQQYQYQEALALFNQAEKLGLKSGEFYFKRGMLYNSMRDYDNMKKDFSKAYKLAPTNSEMLRRMAVPYIHQYDYNTAVSLLEKALKLNPNYTEAWLWLASAHHFCGNDTASYAALKQGHERCPNDARLTIAYHLAMSRLPMSNAMIDEERQRFMEGINTLMASGITIQHPEHEIQFLPNVTAYHGRNDKELRSAYARLMLKLCPSLAYTAPHIASPKPRGERPIRVGIVSEKTQQETTGQFIHSIFQSLKQSPDFELFMFTTNVPSMTQEALKAITDHCLLIQSGLEQARQIIAQAELDILIYLEVGNYHMSYFLSFARLATHQCAWVGFPVTTGIPNMDYFMLPKSDDRPTYKDHFTEAPIFFDDIVAAFEPVNIDNEKGTKATYGLKEGDAKNYMCPALLHKIHPDMDELFYCILKEDPHAYIILFESKEPKIQEILEARLRINIPAPYHKRVCFIPHLPKTKFVHAMSLADAVLDCVHFSFGTTAYLAFSGNVPFVAHRGDFLYRGVGISIYDKIGLSDMAPTTYDEYVALAIKLANDSDFHRQKSEHIRTHADKIFGDSGIAQQVAEKFKSLAQSEELADAV